MSLSHRILLTVTNLKAPRSTVEVEIFRFLVNVRQSIISNYTLDRNSMSSSILSRSSVGSGLSA